MSSTSSNFNLAHAEFYALRSDRTRQCLAGVLPPEIHIAVTFDPTWTTHPAAQPAAETLCNLLGRFCRHVTVTPAPQIDNARLIAALRKSDPFGEFLSGEGRNADLQIRLGNGGAMFAPTIHWRFAGWIGGIGGPVGVNCPLAEHESSVGAETAACLAGAAAFRFWVERDIVGNDFAIDLYSMGEVEGPWDIYRRRGDPKLLNALMIGAGSVGSATAYFVPRLGLRGRLDAVDADIVKVENMDRSPLFSLPDWHANKAVATANFLRQAGLSAEPFPTMWDGFVEQEAKRLRTYDVWLPLANEHDVRRAMQLSVPPVCLQASTGKNWNVTFGRHIPFKDDCQVDRFPDGETAPMICASGTIKHAAGKAADAALPFASFLAGLFVAAALRRHATDELAAGPNAAFLHVKPTFSLWNQTRRPRPECVCQLSSPSQWAQIWSYAPQCSITVPPFNTAKIEG